MDDDDAEENRAQESALAGLKEEVEQLSVKIDDTNTTLTRELSLKANIKDFLRCNMF